MNNIFERVFILFFKIFIYRGYRKKYNLPSEFRFNGYLIRISGDGELQVGKGSYISFYSYLNIIKGTKVVIGDSVSISHNVRIYTSSIDTKRLIVDKEKVSKFGDVRIGNNILIGANVFICPGSEIGDNVVVGANSLVTGKLKSNAVYGGVPARIIREYSCDE